MWGAACHVFGGTFCVFRDAWDSGQHPTVAGIVLSLLAVLAFVVFCAWAWRNR
jgi:hypothetical protein